MTEIIAQIIGIIAVVFAILSFQAKTDRYLLIMQTGAAFLFCIHYGMLGAYTGMAMNSVSVVRNIVYYNKDKKIFSGWLPPVFFASVMALFGIFTWQGWHSLLVIVGLIVNSIGMSLRSPQNIRKSVLISCPLVLVYNVFELSIGGIINESFSIVSAVVGILRDKRMHKGSSCGIINS